ncbi:MAG: hypothetical protein RIF34_08950 [Candidatus Kapaibacterium sp.]
MSTTKTYTFVFAIITLFSTGLLGQDYELSNPLEPSTNSLAEESLGGFLGIGPNWAGGKHFVNCEGCEFQDGTATGFTFGGIYQRIATKNLYFGAMLSLDVMNINSSYRENEAVDISTFGDFTNDETITNIEFRHVAEMRLTYLGLAPFLAYYPANWLTLRVAPKISFPISSNLLHTKTPTSRTVTIDGVEGRLRFTEDDTKVQDSEVSELISPLISSDFTMMFNLTPGERSNFSLGFTQNIPFTQTSSFGDNFVINSWRIFFEFKFLLQKAYDQRPKSAKK